MQSEGEQRYSQLVARVQAERNGRPLTLNNLAAAANASIPYLVAKILAAQGLAVFPVRSKQPLTDSGVYDATCDLAKLNRMNWHRADGCGLATGAVNNLDVFDVDVRLWDQQELRGREVPPSADGDAVLAGLGDRTETLTARTPNNGRHFFYQHVEGSKSRSRLGGDARLEWFSDRKLVVVPPAPGRAWLNCADVGQVPEFLKALVLAPRQIDCEDAGGMEEASGPLVLSCKERDVPRDIYFLILSGMAKAKPKVRRRVKGLWRNLAGKQEHRNDCLNYTTWQFSGFVALACRANGYLKKRGPDVVREVIGRVLKWQRE